MLTAGLIKVYEVMLQAFQLGNRINIICIIGLLAIQYPKGVSPR